MSHYFEGKVHVRQASCETPHWTMNMQWVGLSVCLSVSLWHFSELPFNLVKRLCVLPCGHF